MMTEHCETNYIVLVSIVLQTPQLLYFHTCIFSEDCDFITTLCV